MNNRYEINKKILEKLEEYVNTYPDMRFIQLLYAIGIIDGTDKFYEESKITLKNISYLIKENK